MGGHWGFTPHGLLMLVVVLILTGKLVPVSTYNVMRDELLPNTTSPLEGGINAGIKDLLRRHRGMKPRACDGRDRVVSQHENRVPA